MPAESLRAAPTPNFWPAEAPTRGCGKCTGPRAVTEQTTNSAAVVTGLPTYHPQSSPPHSCRQRQARMAEGATPIRAAVATKHPTHHFYGHRPRCYQKYPTDNEPRDVRAVPGRYAGARLVSVAGSVSSSRACSDSTPTSASVCAEPTWTRIRGRPAEYSATCTAVAPDAVRTRRMNAQPDPVSA